MARVVIVRRIGLHHPMIRCPLTNMGIVLLECDYEWNGNINFPTFDKEIEVLKTGIFFTVKDGSVIYPLNDLNPYSGKTVDLKGWESRVNKEDAEFYKCNRVNFGVKQR